MEILTNHVVFGGLFGVIGIAVAYPYKMWLDKRGGYRW
jgi:hypothetical protein